MASRSRRWRYARRRCRSQTSSPLPAANSSAAWGSGAKRIRSEANNLIDAKRKVAKRLAETLDRYLQAQGQPMTEPDRIPIAPDLRKRLEALGYLEP